MRGVKLIMVEILFNNYVMAGIIGVIFVIGAFCKVVIGTSLSNIIKESENMNNTRQTLLKQIKLKYESCHRLNLRINNVSAFINKYIYKHKIIGVSIKRLNSIANTSFLLCGTLGLASGVVLYLNSVKSRQIVIYISAGIILSICGFIWGNVIDIKSKIEMLKINIQDYLENSLKNKLVNELVSNDNQNNNELIHIPIAEVDGELAGQVNLDSLQELGLKNEIIDNNIIEEILREYLA